MKEFLDGQRRLDAIRDGVDDPFWSETRTEYFENFEALPRLEIVPAPGLSSGQRATLFAALFFLTVAVAMWATTLPTFGAFLMGMGWMLVLAEISRWVESIERRQRPAPAAAPELEEVDAQGVIVPIGSRQIREDYRLNHDVRDFATLPCRYGCTEPVTCPWPHADCQHCFKARQAARPDGR